MRNSAIQHSTRTESLGDILERVLDKGVVIAGDITIGIAEIELLTIKIRLLVASVDKAREIGVDWWQNDPFLSSQANRTEVDRAMQLETHQTNKAILERLEALESKLGA